MAASLFICHTMVTSTTQAMTRAKGQPPITNYMQTPPNNILVGYTTAIHSSSLCCFTGAVRLRGCSTEWGIRGAKRRTKRELTGHDDLP